MGIHNIFRARRGGQCGRWLAGLYLDQPKEWDDLYRFFHW